MRWLPLLLLLCPLVARADWLDDLVEPVRREGPPALVVGYVRAGEAPVVRAFGMARLQPAQPAQPSMAFAIGSVSKQFLAALMLKLQEEGRLSLDDPVAKYFPDLTRSGDISLRALLSHTSGYSDYYPQDYLPDSMKKPITPQEILGVWAQRPLDFEPGSKWQYSNTNYVLAGAVVEKVTGQSLATVMRQKILEPLGLQVAAQPEPQGYFSHAGGPPRALPREAQGWLYATGDLVMGVKDLLQWDRALAEHRLLGPESTREMERVVLTSDGVSSGYGLGLFVSREFGRRCLSHGGEVAGFCCENLLFPEEDLAVVVVSNQMVTAAPRTLSRQIARRLLSNPQDPASVGVRRLVEGLARGQIDATALTPNAQAYFDAATLTDIRSQLEPLGPLLHWELASSSRRGGMEQRTYRAEYANRRFAVLTFQVADGRLEQLLLLPIP